MYLKQISCTIGYEKIELRVYPFFSPSSDLGHGVDLVSISNGNDNCTKGQLE